MSRNIINTTNNGRDITNTGSRTFSNTAILPLEITDISSITSTISMKGLSGFTANKIIKVNSAGNALEYVDETDTVYTATSPLLLSGTAFSISQALFTTATDFFDGDFIPYFKAEGTQFRKIERLAFLTNVNYLGVSPIAKNNTSFSYELDFSGLSANGDTITDASEFIISTDAAKTIKSLTYLNLKNGIKDYTVANLGLSATKPITVNTSNELALDMSSFPFQTSINSNDEFLYSSTGGTKNDWRRVTFATLSAIISGGSALNPANVNDFGTNLQLGTRTLGNNASQVVVSGSITKISSANQITMVTTNSSDNIIVNLNNAQSSITNGSDNAIVGFSTTGNRCYLGNSTNDSELFSDLTYAKKLNASFGDGNFLFGVSNARIRIASGSNSVDPVIEIFSKNTSNVAQGAYIFGDISNDLNLATDNAARFTVILNQLKPTNSIHLTNLSSSGTVAMKYYFGSSTTSTSTVAWRNQINSNGNYHWDFATNTAGAGNWAIKGFINFSVSGVPQMNFTGQHRCIPEEEDLYDNVNEYIGMVVEATGQYNSIDFEEEEIDTILEDKIEGHFDIKTNEWIEEQLIHTPIKKKIAKTITTNEPSINESQPIIRLTTTAKSKKVYGVISSGEDGEKRTFSSGAFVSDLGLRDDNRLFINSLGEGGILVCNENGNIENGDYLCSSSISGIAMKQDDDLLHNYTIAKSTMDYNFIDSNERKLIGCTYHCG